MTKKQEVLRAIAIFNRVLNDRELNLNTGEGRSSMLRTLNEIEFYVRLTNDPTEFSQSGDTKISEIN